LITIDLIGAIKLFKLIQTELIRDLDGKDISSFLNKIVDGLDKKDTAKDMVKLYDQGRKQGLFSKKEKPYGSVSNKRTSIS